MWQAWQPRAHFSNTQITIELRYPKRTDCLYYPKLQNAQCEFPENCTHLVCSSLDLCDNLCDLSFWHYKQCICNKLYMISNTTMLCDKLYMISNTTMLCDKLYMISNTTILCDNLCMISSTTMLCDKQCMISNTTMLCDKQCMISNTTMLCDKLCMINNTTMLCDKLYNPFSMTSHVTLLLWQTIQLILYIDIFGHTLQLCEWYNQVLSQV